MLDLLTFAGVDPASRGQRVQAHRLVFRCSPPGIVPAYAPTSRGVQMQRPETPQAAAGAAAEVAGDVAGETPDTAETGNQDAAADAARAGVAPDALRAESATGSPWADDRTTDLDPGRVGADDQQSAAERREGEPDE
jgi:hypothetical protein